MVENKVIETQFLSQLSGIDGLTAIRASDFKEEREPFMVVVGVDKITQMNVGLPDYRRDITILIDTFIEEDKDGSIFSDYCLKVQTAFEPYLLHEQPLSSLFGEVPVVGFFFDGADTNLSDSSNQMRLRYYIVESY